MRRGKPSREYDHLFSSPYVSKLFYTLLARFDRELNSVKCEINRVKRSSDSVTSNGFKKSVLCMDFLQMFWKPYFFSVFEILHENTKCHFETLLTSQITILCMWRSWMFFFLTADMKMVIIRGLQTNNVFQMQMFYFLSIFSTPK